ncbi:MAG: translation initiation factor [Muribaculaceae bacterium]|nr:translation initiation factor [Muribaculaceae bacterium]
MTQDWKNALAGLRANLPDEGETKDSNSESDSTLSDETLQTSPLTIIADKKGRNGKIATIIEGFSISQERVEEIARKLKQQLGVGGSVREGEILIQGNHKEKVNTFLLSMGFKTKLI